MSSIVSPWALGVIGPAIIHIRLRRAPLRGVGGTDLSKATASRWRTVLEELEKRVKPQQFDMWFRATKLVAEEPDKIVVGVPNLFHEEWIETRYGGIVREAVTDALGDPIAVEFVVDSDLYTAARERQLDERASLIGELDRQARPKAPPEKVGGDLNPQMKLENFVQGACNRLAYAASVTVAEGAGYAYNPLFVHGPVGMGKTHLLQGICHRVMSRPDPTTALYVSAESFANQFVQAVRHDSVDAFRHKFRRVGVLVIDDVHFLASKNATQQEFLHTFNALDAGQSRIVMASDSHPKMIAKIRESLIARFVSGLVVELKPPDFGTRQAIVRAKLGPRRLEVDERVVDCVARNFTGSIRELEGAVNTLVACSVLGRRKLTPEFARQVLQSLAPDKLAAPTLEAVERAVLDFYGVSLGEIHSSKRSRRVSWPRHVAMYLGRELTGASFNEIAAHFGGKNHSTAIFAHSKVTQELKNRTELADELKELKTRVTETACRRHAGED